MSAIDCNRFADGERWRAAVSDDLRLLAVLHARELRRADLMLLWARCYDGLLRLRPMSDALHRAQNALCAALTEIPTCFDDHTARHLRQDYWRMHAAAERETHLHGSGDDIGTAAVSAFVDVAGPVVSAESNATLSKPVVSSDDPRATCLAVLAQLVAVDGAALASDALRRLIEKHLMTWVGTPTSGDDCTLRLYRELDVLTACYLREICDLCSATGIGGNQSGPVVTPNKVRAYLDTHHLRHAAEPARAAGGDASNFS